MDTAEIRRRFLAHFEAAGHTPVPSASLLLEDPNLLFVNAGMVPFKPYFLGQETPPYPRATSVQKCVRTPDIEDVGKTTRHGTFFEMCGNFSFGDYFKERAIELAWDLVTRPRRRRRLGARGVAALPQRLRRRRRGPGLWRRSPACPRSASSSSAARENYWSMGVPGPGGPCSEILYDRGPEYGPDFDRDPRPGHARRSRTATWRSGTSSSCRTSSRAVRSKTDFDVAGPLPSKNIDTGMGLERVALPAPGQREHVRDRRDVPGHRAAEELTGRRYGADPPRDDVRFRVVADHVRTCMMLIGDGVTPGNEGRGYVLRRLLRRAVRSMRLLGYEDRALPELLPVSRDRMARDATASCTRDWDGSRTVAFAEEDAFRQTLRAGTAIFDLAARRGASTPAARRSPATEAFALHDTYGFPIDLTLEMASEQGLAVDEDGLPPADGRAARAGQGRRPRQEGPARRRRAPTATIADAHRARRWSSPATTRSPARAPCAACVSGGGAVAAARRRATRSSWCWTAPRSTPRAAASSPTRASSSSPTAPGVEVLDVQSPAHRPDRAPGPGARRRGHRRRAARRRWSTSSDAARSRRAHTATHMVHKAFREALGETATQAGSENAPGPLPVRLLRLRLGAGRGDGRRRGAGQRPGAGRPRGPRRADERRRRRCAPARWPCSARSTATRCASSRSATGRASSAAARTPAAPASSAWSSCWGSPRSAPAYAGSRRWSAATPTASWPASTCWSPSSPTRSRCGPSSCPSGSHDLVERLRAAEKEIEKVRVAAAARRGRRARGRRRGRRRRQVVATAPTAPPPATCARSRSTSAAGCRPAARRRRDHRLRRRQAVAVVVAVNDEARSRGLSANALVRAAAQLLGGRGGGKDDVAQGGGADAARSTRRWRGRRREVGRRGRPGLTPVRRRRTARARPRRRPDRRRHAATRPGSSPPRWRRCGAERATWPGSARWSPSTRRSRSSWACRARCRAARVRPRPRRASSPRRLASRLPRSRSAV